MPLTPAAKPSRPSSQLIALVIPTSHTTVASRLNQAGSINRALGWPMKPRGNSMLPMRTPSPQTTAETASCPAKRGSGGKAKRSSAKPMKKKHRAPAKVVQINWSLVVGSWAKPPRLQTRPNDRLKASTIPTPPSRTMGVVCCLRASGASIKPQCSPSLRTPGTSKAVSAAATENASRAAALGLWARVTGDQAGCRAGWLA